MKLKFNNPNFFNKGFTLVELMVVFSISSLIGLVVIIGYPDFASNIEFKNQALDIAITIREAQVYGVSVKDAGVSSFDAGYGVNFKIDTPTEYILFADINNDKFYDSAIDSMVGDPFVLKNGYSITDICVKPPLSVVVCNSDNNPAFAVDKLSIFFKRPNPDATIKYGILGDYSYSIIELQNIAGNIKTIRVTNTGQVSVQ